MAKFFCFLIFILSAISAKAQFFTDKEERIHELILQLEVDQAKQEIMLNSRLSPSLTYLNCFASFMEAVIEADPVYAETFFDDCEKALDQLSKYDNGAQVLTFKGQIRFFSALINYREENSFSAAYDLLKAYNIADELKESHPNYVHGYPLRIVIEGLLASLPESVAENLALFGFEGDMKNAKAMLRELRAKADEPHYRYLEVYSYFLEDYVSIQAEPSTFSSKPIPVELKDYPVVLLYKSLFLTNSFNADEALKFIKQVKLSDKQLEPTILYYLEGKCKLFLLQKDAYYPLKTFLDKHKGRDFLKSANLHLAYYYLLEGNLELSEYYKSQIGKRGASRTGFDAFAEKEAGQPLHKDLVKAQLLFDGGSFAELKRFLERLNTANWTKEDQVEVLYRKARLAQMQQEEAVAVKYFEELVTAPDHIQVYMQANAYLQLAKIAYVQGDCTPAIAQAKKCLEFKSYPYDDGIRLKAKAIISNCN